MRTSRARSLLKPMPIFFIVPVVSRSFPVIPIIFIIRVMGWIMPPLVSRFRASPPISPMTFISILVVVRRSGTGRAIFN